MARIERHIPPYYRSLQGPSLVERWFSNVDQAAILLIVILFFVGLTVQSIAAGELSEVKWGKHAFLGSVGLIGMLVLSMTSRRQVMLLVPVLFLLSVALMLATLAFGIEKNGAVRWLRLPLVAIQFQPMELYKICSVSTLAIVLGWMTEMDVSKGLRTLVTAGFVGLTVLFGLAQPDLGQMIITVLAMVFITLLSVRLRLVWLAGVVTVLVAGIFGLLMTMNHGVQRINSFLFGTVSDKSQQWYALNSLDRALLFGRPEGDSRWQHLPDVETDYVFVLIAEEFGLLMALLLVSMLVYLLLRFLWRVWNTEEIKLKLWVWGVVVMYTAQIFVNVGTANNIGPTKGITLPILSYGGSSLLAVFFSFGLLLFATRRDIKDA